MPRKSFFSIFIFWSLLFLHFSAIFAYPLSSELETRKSYLTSESPRDTQYPIEDGYFQAQTVSVLASNEYENKTSHEGDIIVENNEIFVIENCEYNQTGNIIVKDNATLTIKNATLLIFKPDYYADRYIHGITVKDQARLIIEQANLTSIRLNLAGNPFYDNIGISLMDFSKTDITQSVIMLGNIRNYNSSSLNIKNCFYQGHTYEYLMGMASYDSSVISVTNCTSISGIGVFGSSSLFVNNWTLPISPVHGRPMAENELSVQDSSSVLVMRSQVSLGFSLIKASLNLTFSGGYVNYWNPYINKTIQAIDFNLTVIDTEINELDIHLSNSTIFVKDSSKLGISAQDTFVFVENSNLTGLGTDGSSVISVQNTTFGGGKDDRGGLSFWGSTSASIKDSDVGFIDLRGHPKVTLENSRVRELIGLFFGSPSVELINSTTPLIEHYNGLLSISNSSITGYWGIKCYSNAFITNSTISRIMVKGGSSIWLINSQIDALEVSDEAIVYKGWYLTVDVVLNNEPLERAFIEVYYVHNQSLAINGTTGKNGSIRFILPQIVIRSGMRVEQIGRYTIKAIYENLTSEDNIVLDKNMKITLAVARVAEYFFTVFSNSTISELVFNSTSRILSFTVSGPTDTIGYVNVTISKELIRNIEELKVSLDGDEINYTTLSIDDSWIISFTYLHSVHNVVISLGTPPGVIENPVLSISIFKNDVPVVSNVTLLDENKTLIDMAIDVLSYDWILPVGTYYVQASVFYKEFIYTSEEVRVDLTEYTELAINFPFGNLTISCLDNENRPLENCTVIFTRENEERIGYTGSLGLITLEAYYGNWTVKAYWMGVLVGEANIQANQSEVDLNIRCKVGDLTVIVVDQYGHPVEANMSLRNDAYDLTFSSRIRKPLENITFTQIPLIDYALTIKDGFKTETYTVDGSQTRRIRIEIIVPKPFIETPLGIATIGGVITLVIALAIIIIRRKVS